MKRVEEKTFRSLTPLSGPDSGLSVRPWPAPSDWSDCRSNKEALRNLATSQRRYFQCFHFSGWSGSVKITITPCQPKTLTHLPKRPPVDIGFTDLTYTVSEGRKKRKYIVIFSSGIAKL
ncbi:hypothetical protein V9T40_008889 [Parthenolecanium corni]|uniref:Uncharacterized protein n=1 Tax=Parthenolecanium corni TaxID=536013 RepID=A0AAN9U0E7_9HEMI